MTLEESLKLERYKLVVDRQKYFTELARDAFASYVRFLAVLAAAGITLISTHSKLELRPEVLLYVFHGIVWLLSFLGVAAGAQIIFCLVRWYQFRTAERKIYSESPRIGHWWWIFETLYVIGIAVSIAALWHILRELPTLLATN